MATSKSKADMAEEMLDEISVEEWDERLRRIARSWQRAYTNRQLRAEEEGIDTPPPAPPWAGIETATAIPSGSASQKKDDASALTLEALIEAYQSSEDSPFHEVQYTTQRYYISLCRPLKSKAGHIRIADLDEESIRTLYETWTEGGTKRKSISLSMIRMLRMLASFGARSLGDAECARLIGVLTHMEFDKPPPRTERLTEEYVDLIRSKAHELNRPSIALAQAFQFDLGLKQKDVVGEWVPFEADGISLVKRDAERLKWMRGLRWEQIDGNTLHFGNEKFDLTKAPKVMAELKKVPRGSGPIIVCEYTGRPWVTNEFRRWWRKIADEAGVPPTVRNTDAAAVAREKNRRATGGVL
jgi:hypothetical protein